MRAGIFGLRKAIRRLARNARQRGDKVLENEMMALLEKESCCGQKMAVYNQWLCPDTGGMAVCLKCGNTLTISGGQLDEEVLQTYREMEGN